MSEPDREGRRLAYLRAMGVEVFVPRSGTGARSEERGTRKGKADAGPRIDLAESAGRQTDREPCGSSSLDPSSSNLAVWEELQTQVANCRACELCQSRTQTVFGVGNRDADLMIIGEAPGADEDRQGEPFVGRAGQLLTAMLRAIGFAREDVFIANILKCRPPGNRNPTPEEAAACRGFLQRQIDLVKPRLILSVGAVSAHNLLGTDEAVGRLRRRVHRYEPGSLPLLVTYHPAYLLRRPEEKAKSWEDLQQAWRLLH